jgi:probable H4MPT-linked C1 transfer pathway protein
MAAPLVLGLDIGGANLKAAAPDGRAVSVPFALWKQPDTLPAALAELVARFPDAAELAVTMTGELCDCFETKRQGVTAILNATEHAAAGRPVRVWGTDGAWHTPAEARANHLTVAAANWHALATFAGRYAPEGDAMLFDIGSTTSDLIPLRDGKPAAVGTTDFGRLRTGELLYIGVRRTPVCAVMSETGERVAAELFATTQDVYLVLGDLPEDPDDRDTADNRPATKPYAQARLARMLGADAETMTAESIRVFAEEVDRWVYDRFDRALMSAYVANDDTAPPLETVVLSGAGEFLARRVLGELTKHYPAARVLSLNDALGPAVSACAPAYAVAVLAAERGRPATSARAFFAREGDGQ